MREHTISYKSILAFLILQIFVHNINSKPLTKEVLQYLDADKLTFTTYKDQYKELACKLLTFSRMKNLYDEEVIDKYLNQTDNKMGYLDLLHEKIQNKCMNTLENNMEIFEINLYVKWDERKNQLVDVNLTSLLANFTKTQSEEINNVKSDL